MSTTETAILIVVVLVGVGAFFGVFGFQTGNLFFAAVGIGGHAQLADFFHFGVTLGDDFVQRVIVLRLLCFFSRHRKTSILVLTIFYQIAAFAGADKNDTIK